METSTSVQPAFDPNNVGKSIDNLSGKLPIIGTVFAGQVVGEIAMRTRGDGTDMRNIRDYVIGDNVRNIDWKSTAKHPMGNLQVIDHNRDIKPNFFLVTDVLQSRYESIVTSEDHYLERNLALSACMGLLQLASKGGMPGRAIAINDEGIVGPTPLGRGSSHLLKTGRMLAKGISQNGDRLELLKANPDSAIERPRLADVLEYAAKTCTNSLVAVVSDFRDADPRDEDAGWRQSLRALKARNNSIISVTINSPADFELPADQARFATEQGVVYIPKGKKGRDQRERYSELAVENAQKIAATLKSVRAHQISLSTADPKWATSFRKQLKQQ